MVSVLVTSERTSKCRFYSLSRPRSACTLHFFTSFIAGRVKNALRD